MFSCVAAGSLGQVSVHGTVSIAEQAVPDATVLLLDADSAFVKGTLTDSIGQYRFDHVSPGRYRVSCSVVGYLSFVTELFSADNQDIALTGIMLQETSVTLKEVTVNADKPMFERYPDKLVVNVQGSVTLSGNIILQVLQKTPGVMVNRQNNSISIDGRSGVRVMINGKLMLLQPEAVVQMLDGMSSAHVDAIEIITIPPANYDAEGSAGIIHIVTKKNRDLGTTGTYGFTLGAHWAETAGGNFALSHRGKKIAATVDYSVLTDHNLHHSEVGRRTVKEDFVQTVLDVSPHRENVTTQQNLNAGLEWKLSDHTLLNVLVTGYRRNWSLRASADDDNKVTADSTVVTDLRIRESNIWQSATAGVGLQSEIGSKSKLGVNVDYLYYRNSNPSHYNTVSLYEQQNRDERSEIDLKKDTPIGFVVAGTDYQYNPSPQWKLEAGLKAVASRLNNNVDVQRLTQDGWKADPFLTSRAALKEQTGAAYVSVYRQLKDQWNMTSGLRYEYTHTTIGTPVQKDLINRKYGYFFPSLSLKKELGDERDLLFSFSRRISRPTYNDIAPYVFFWGPTTFSSGNTALWPAVASIIKAGYRVQQWNVSMQYSSSKKEIVSYQPENDNTSASLIYRAQNLKYANSIAFTNSYSFSPASWWEIQSSLTTQYQFARTSNLPLNRSFHRYALNVNMTSIWHLPKDVTVEISGFYQSALQAGIAAYLPQGSLNAGIQKKMGAKGTLQLAADDLLNTNYWRIRTTLPQNNLDTFFNYNFHNRFIRLTYSRKLGNAGLRTVKMKQASEEERRRVN